MVSRISKRKGPLQIGFPKLFSKGNPWSKGKQREAHWWQLGDFIFCWQMPLTIQRNPLVTTLPCQNGGNTSGCDWVIQPVFVCNCALVQQSLPVGCVRWSCARWPLLHFCPSLKATPDQKTKTLTGNMGINQFSPQSTFRWATNGAAQVELGYVNIGKPTKLFSFWMPLKRK